MIAIARRNLSSLFWKPNSFLCKSNAHPFSSSSRIPRPGIYDVLVHRHQFSPELASSLAASFSPKSGIAVRADSFLSFLKENSFTTAQLQKIAKSDPRILGYRIEGVESRLKVFQELGLSSEEIAQILSSQKSILESSVAKKIIPRLSLLRGLLGSNDEVARLLKKCSWFLSSDLQKTLMPNVDILRGRGVPDERVLRSLFVHPRSFLIKPDVMRKSVDKAIRIGVPLTSAQFIQAAHILACVSEGAWEVKLRILRGLGFSENDVFTMFRIQPSAFSASGERMKGKVEFVVANGEYDLSSIVACPAALTCSVEKRIEPRMRITRLLLSRNLIRKWPSLSSLLLVADDKFVQRYVRPYYDEIGEERIIEIYIPRPKGDYA